ncbi:MAG: SLATT domain-containing protein [Opitutaceae bacterium]|nr:SLATT domain-containing protein [Opitutaceae bacterium]
MPEASEPSPVLRAVWIVGVLGHRRLSDPAGVETVLERELRSLAAAAKARGGEIHLLVSVAAGTDLVAIRVARRLGLPVHLLLPLPEQEFLTDFAGQPEALAEAKAALAEVRAHLDRDSVNIALTRGGRPECYFDTDVRLIESADVLIPVWDGLPTGNLGGTGEIVALGSALKKPMVTIHPTRLTVTVENFEPQTWPPFDAQWDWIVKQEIVAPAPDCTSDLARANLIRARLSKEARSDAFDFRKVAQLLIILSALGGLIGMTHGILAGRNPGHIVTVLQAVQFVLSLWALRERRRFTRAALVVKWTNARIGAEICRGLEAGLPFTDPLRPIAGNVMPEWRRFAVSFGILTNRHRQSQFARQPDPLIAFRDDYARERLENQEQYFAKELVKSSRRARRLPDIAKRCTQATPIFVAVAMLNRVAKLNWGASQWGLIVVTVLPAVLPIVAAVSDGLVSTFDHKRRSDRFKDTAHSLRLLRAELAHLRTEDSIRNLVDRAERLLLIEHLEWRYVTRRIKL